MINEEYIAKLLTIVADHPKAPCAQTLKELIAAPYANQKSLAQLHTEINNELATKGARGSRWSRWRHHTDQHHQQLRLALTRAMSEELTLFTNQQHVPILQPSRPTQPLPALLADQPVCSPEQFNRELFLAHVSYTENDEITLVNNAIMELIDSYRKHHVLYAQANEEIKKKFHQTRLLVLQEWISQQGYQSFRKAITVSTGILTHKNTAMPLTLKASEMGENTQNTQHVLNWLGIVYEHFFAAESPYAMSHALKIIHLIHTKESDTQLILQEVDQYISFYIGSESVAEVNIDAKARTDLLTNVIRLHNATRGRQSERCKEVILAIKENLRVINNELGIFLTAQTQLAEQHERLLSEFNPETSEHFFSYFDTALNFRARAIEAKSKNETHQTYEPIKAYVTEGMFFTPHDWKLVEGDLSNESKRLSIRSNSSRKSSTPGHSDRSESSERNALRQSESSPSLRSLLNTKRRTRSNHSVGEFSSSENLDQVAAKPDENSEPLKLK